MTVEFLGCPGMVGEIVGFAAVSFGVGIAVGCFEIGMFEGSLLGFAVVGAREERPDKGLAVGRVVGL